MPTSIRTKIIVFFALLLLAVAACVLLVASRETGSIFRQHNFHELELAERVMQRVISQNLSRLGDSAAVLAGDFAFRSAVSSNDRATVSSVLANHGARIGANVSLLLDLGGQVIADTLPATARRTSRPLNALLPQAESTGSGAGLAIIGGQAYEVALVPVLAPDPIAWVAIGFELNKALAAELKALSAVEVSFLLPDGRGGMMQGASTLPVPARDALLGIVRGDHGRHDRMSSVQLQAGDADIRLVPLSTATGETLLVALEVNDAGARETFAPLLNTLAVVTAFGLFLCLVGGVFVANQITKPLSGLAAVAQRIRDGDYTATVGTPADDELGEFSRTFEHMRIAIAGREAEILRLAYEDPLTHLPNRASLLRDMDLRCGQDGAFALLLIDLQRFHLINSTLGHEAGDELLAIVANRLQGMVRKSDLVARIGSNAFAVVLPIADPLQLAHVASHLHEVLAQRVFVGLQEIDVTASIGGVQFPLHGAVATTLLRCGELALFEAKRTRSGFCCYEPGMDGQQSQNLHLLGDLRRAEQEGQLLLMYQPKIGLLDGKVLGVEALVRWRHPERGMVPPGDFLPFAEQTGAIRPISRWVIGEAVGQVAKWRDGSIKLQVSINISARDLADETLVNHVGKCLANSGVDASELCIEITESAMMEDANVAHATIERLRLLGVAISIDDYGTGYSSLAYIKNLKASEIKIDRAFVKDLDSSIEDLAIVQSTIDLGHNLGLRVVAEGVETVDQLRKLREMGCDYAQGFLLSRPVMPEVLVEWLGRFNLAGLVDEKMPDLPRKCAV